MNPRILACALLLGCSSSSSPPSPAPEPDCVRYPELDTQCFHGYRCKNRSVEIGDGGKPFVRDVCTDADGGIASCEPVDPLRADLVCCYRC